MLLTIGVAAYNAEKTLERCLDSILNQEKLFSYEILIINDGSYDKTEEILKLYENKYKNIRCITNKNNGLAETRNIIIKNSRGKYLWFVDSDDTISKESFKILNDSLKLSKQIYVLGCNIIGEEIIYNYNSFENCPQIYNNLKKVKNIDVKKETQFLLYSSSPWLFIFNVEFMEKSKITFLKDYAYEDLMTVPKYMIMADSILYLGENLYNYYLTDNSILRNKDRLNMRKDIVTALKEVEKFAREKGEYERYKEEINYLYSIHIHSIYNDVFKIDNNSDVLGYITRETLENNKKLYKNKYFKELTLKEKVIRYLEFYNLRMILKFIKNGR